MGITLGGEKKVCPFKGLTAIMVGQPTEEFIRGFSAQDLLSAVETYCLSDPEKLPADERELMRAVCPEPEEKRLEGIAVAYWGAGDLLSYAMIVDLSSGKIYDRDVPIVGIADPCEDNEDGDVVKTELRNLLLQASGYLEGDRFGKYFLLTCCEGCCKPKKSIQADLDDFMQLYG